MDTAGLTKAELADVEAVQAVLRKCVYFGKLDANSVDYCARKLSAAVRASRRNGQRLAEIGWTLGLVSSPGWIV